MLCTHVLLFFSIFLRINAVPPQACHANFKWDDCGRPPVKVLYYWKAGSRCEVGIWRGCLPNLNMFQDEYECVATCIFTSRAEPADYHALAGTEKPASENLSDNEIPIDDAINGTTDGGPKQDYTTSTTYGGPQENDITSTTDRGSQQNDTSNKKDGGPQQNDTSSTTDGGLNQNDTSSNATLSPKKEFTDSPPSINYLNLNTSHR